MRVLVIGCGAIGSTLAEAAEGIRDVREVLLFDEASGRAEAVAAGCSKARAVPSFEEGLAGCEVVVEAASQAAVRAFGVRALAAGRDLVVVSVGALADDALREELVAEARARRCRVHVPSGAVGGLDLVRAAHEASVDEVTLVTAKPPGGLGRQSEGMEGPETLFEGTARVAVAQYPKNVNVAAALALAGSGFEGTRVRVVADPGLDVNTHTVVLRGAFGEARVEVRNRPFPTNPATSYLAALSAVALLRRLASPLQVG